MLRLNFGVDCDNLFYRTQKGSVFNGFRLSKRRFSVVPVAAGEERPLSKIELQRLAEVPPEAEWFGNLTNENTKRAYRHDVTSFMRFGHQATGRFSHRGPRSRDRVAQNAREAKPCTGDGAAETFGALGPV